MLLAVLLVCRMAVAEWVVADQGVEASEQASGDQGAWVRNSGTWVAGGS